MINKLSLFSIFALLTQVSWAAPSGTVSWNGWEFNYDVSGKYDGLSLMSVKFQGTPLINKISFPVMRVFYENNVCGPYADRLGGTIYPIPWANNATVVKREFTLNDKQWYEIGIRDQIGNYDIYQVYYLSSEGILDAHIYSKGLQCMVDHVHYPNWRIDFDINGSANDRIQRNTDTGFETKLTEFNANATQALNHGWRVYDSVTMNYVDILPGFTDFTIPNSNTVAISSYLNNTVFGRLYRSTEDVGWTYGPNVQVPYNNGELISGKNIVFWYEGYLNHSASEGSSLWHSTGLRMVVNNLELPQPTENTQVFSNETPITIRDYNSASLYPSTIDVAGMSGVIKKVIVKVNGLSHTWPDDIDMMLVSPSGRKYMLMSDSGGGFDINNISMTFDSAVTTYVPNSAQILPSATYRLTNNGTTDSLIAPAPARPYELTLTTLNETSPNGQWRLYVYDDERLDSGSISSGWSLIITTN